MPAKVERLNLEARACDLDVKPGAPLNRVRKVSGASEASASLLKAPRPLLGPILAHNVDVPPPPLACGFKAGDQVQYFSETKQRWVETLVLRMFELEGNICYDLDCKKGVSADKVRSSPRASQERYEVGEQVEYWSVSAGRWLPAKVQVVRLDLGRCDLDIKLAAPIGRIRRPIARPEPPVETAVCLSEEEDEVPPMPHALRKPLPPPPPMPLPLPVQAAQPTQEPTKVSETAAEKQEPEKRGASPSPSPAAKEPAAEPAEEPVKKSPEPEPVRQKSPSQDSSQESEEEEKPARQDMEITRTPTPPRHVLEAAQQASQAYRSPVQLQGPDEPTSPADCIRVELDEESSQPTERPPKEEEVPEPEPPAAPAAPEAPAPVAEQPLKRLREPSEDLDLEAPPTLPRSVKAGHGATCARF
ncbi:zmpB [Symbiodinium sp. CCMP2456]|nr:zmpB [Symbiodinium sp. CCMP2456]